MTRTAIIAALAGELKPLVRGWQQEQRNGVDLWTWRFDQGEWIAACAGAGVNAATRAFAEVEKGGSVDRVISVGWAGALSRPFAAAQAYRVSGVIDVKTGERFSVAGQSNECLLATSPIVAGETEKRRLATTYHAALVDMEAAGIARVAVMRGIPFDCIKGISDGFDEKLPDLNGFIAQDGRFQLTRFVLFAILRPWHWPALVRMGENSKKASQNIAESLLDFLDQHATIRERNGYPNLNR